MKKKRLAMGVLLSLLLAGHNLQGVSLLADTESSQQDSEEKESQSSVTAETTVAEDDSADASSAEESTIEETQIEEESSSSAVSSETDGQTAHTETTKTESESSTSSEKNSKDSSTTGKDASSASSSSRAKSSTSRAKTKQSATKKKSSSSASSPKSSRLSLETVFSMPEVTPSSGSEIDASYKASEVSDSNLRGFELPVLGSLEEKSQGALIYGALQQLGEADKKMTSLTLISELYETLFAYDLGDSLESFVEKGEQIPLGELSIGDLVFWEKDGKLVKVGLYLGQEKYIYAAPLTEQEKNVKKEKAETENERDNGQYNKQTDQQKEEALGLDNTLIQLGKLMLVKENDTKEERKEKASFNKEDEKTQAVYTKVYGVGLSGVKDLTKAGQKLVADYPATVDFQKNLQTERFIESIAEDARELGLEYDVFASVMIAQAILESGSGMSQLASAPHYNLFGIKGSFKGQYVSFSTQEDRGDGSHYSIQALFRSYPSYKEALGDYVNLIRGGVAGNDAFYQSAWRSEAKNYLRATDALTGKYATDTAYNNKLNSIIAAYNLTQYDSPKEGELVDTVIHGKENIPEIYRKRMIYPDYNHVDYNTSRSYPVGQCTWYAFNRVSQLGKKVDDYMGNGAEWGTTGAKLGYRVTTQPKTGYLISFKPGVAGYHASYGHVAFVEAVTDEGILISEGGDGLNIYYRVIPNSIAKSSGVSYIQPK